MSEKYVKLHDEDVITYGGEDDLFSYKLSMPATFRVQELKDEISRNFDSFDGVSSKCRILSHSNPGWKSGEINVKIEVIIEFEEAEVNPKEQSDSLEKLRQFKS